MTDISYISTPATTDLALLVSLGSFIRQQRLQQNKTQGQLAKEAGISRSTLSLFEKGENTGILVFIQVLRSLKLLQLLEIFQMKQQVSPLALAKLERSKRLRASRGETGRKKSPPQSDW